MLGFLVPQDGASCHAMPGDRDILAHRSAGQSVGGVVRRCVGGVVGQGVGGDVGRGVGRAMIGGTVGTPCLLLS